MRFYEFDDDYVRRLGAGEGAVESHFADYFGRMILVKLRCRIRSQQLIEDVRQETLARVLLIVKRKGVRDARRLGSFVNSVCNNTLRELLRAEVRDEGRDQSGFQQSTWATDPDEPLVSEERKRQVKAVLDGLSVRDRSLLREVFLDESDKEEVCDRHGVSRQHLRVLLHRAKSRFRDEWTKREETAF